MKKILYTLLLIVSASVVAQAQQTSENLIKLMAKKQLISAKEADSLIAVEKKAEPAKTLYLVDKVKLFGYGQIGYQYSDTLAQREKYGVTRVITFIDAKLTKELAFQIQANLSSSTSQLVEFWMEWSPKTYFKLKAGQMKVPFTIENLMSLSVLENISGSQVINALAGGPTDVLSCAGRDAGVQVSGSFLPYQKRNLIDYQIGLFNGNGINNLDNNRHKDVAAWLMFNPTSFLKVGGSVYAGKNKYKTGTDAVAIDHVRNRWSIGSELTTQYLYGRAEYVHGNDAGTDRQGYYVLMNGHVSKKLDLIGQYDYYNKNLNVSNNCFTNYQIGLQWNFFKRSRLQLHYVFKDNNKAGAKFENVVLGQLQVGF